MKSFSFIFAGTSSISLNCLKILFQSPAFTPKGLIVSPSSVRGRGQKLQHSPIKLFTIEKGLPVWSPKNLSDPGFLTDLSKKSLDFCFVCAYGKIFPPAFLKLFPQTAINLHFSLLPRWRGAAPIQRALMAGDKKTGISLQVMSEELDAGPIIGQREFEIETQDNATSLFSKALIDSKSLLQKELVNYLKGELIACPQEHAKKTYARKIEKKEAKILWTKDSFTLHNQIRALAEGPQAYSSLKGKRIKIHRAALAETSNFSSSKPSGSKLSDFRLSDFKLSNFKPGEICFLSKNQLLVACGKGALSLIELQIEGRKKQTLKDFLNGYPLSLKDQFN